MARVAFCQDTLIEYMGFMQMSAVLKAAGHEVEVFFDDQLDPAGFIDQVVGFRPDVVGFSVLTPSREWAIRTAGALHRSGPVVTVCGNVDVILNPDAYVRDGAFDLICIGEGEFAMADLCEAIDLGRPWGDIDGFWWVDGPAVTKNEPRAQLVDMDELPAVDRDLYDKYRYFRRSPYLRVYAGRGCPYRCSFCSNTTMTDAFGGGKRYWRKRSPERFVADLEAMIASRPNRIRRIYIIDEVLWLDRRWLREFLELYRDRIGLPFSMNFKFNGGVREEDVALLAEAKAECFVATETGDEELRRGLLNKPVTNQHILDVTSWMHEYGVAFGSSAFFGLPGQTFEGHLADLEFFRAVGPKYLWTTFFQPYPGIELTADPAVAERLPEDVDFGATLHNDMYLDLPDRTRLVNLKKVYFLMYRFPRSERVLAALCRFRIPLLFDLLFASHFFAYALWAEGCSLFQLATHIKNFAINPALRRIQPLNSTGRPFDIGYGDPAGSDAGSDAEGRPVVDRGAEVHVAGPTRRSARNAAG